MNHRHLLGLPLVSGLSGLLFWMMPTMAIAQQASPEPIPDQIPALPAPLPAASSSPTDALVLPQNSGYILGPGDRLRMDVFNVPEYTREYQVLSDGTLNLPLVGTVPVYGLTIEQAAVDINQRYGRYIRRPAITLDLLAARPLQIAIVGEVNRPGTYEVAMTGETGDSGVVTVTQAIQLAGGITQAANVRQIQVRRPDPANPAAQTVLDVSLWALLQQGDLSQDVALRAGDTVVIPTATVLNSSEATAVSTASFSPDTITVNVVGEVEVPGALQVPPNTPLNQALLAAGGFNTRAYNDSVELIRLNPNGTVSRRQVDVDLAQGVNEDNNPSLRSNDIVVVRRSGMSTFADAVGAFLPPVGGLINLFNGLTNILP